MCVPLHEVVVLLCLVFGASWSVLDCFSVFFGIFFGIFSEEPFAWVLLSFPEPFSVFFFLGRIGGILLSPYIVVRFTCVSLFVFKFFQYARQASHILQPVGSLASDSFCHFCVYLHLWPLRFDSPSLLSSLLFAQRTSPLILQHGSSPCFQHCLPRYFQLCLGWYRLAFLSCRYIEIAGSLCLPSPVAPRFNSLSLLSSLLSCREPRHPFSSVALPPVSSIVSCVISSSALDSTSSLSSVADTLRLPPFCVYLHDCFCHPRLLLGLPGSVDQSFVYGIACLL